eukprot:NODE_11410_length_454_cov_32.048338_g10755_i0.p1 GENE.NODE_11410_length_454_cov_32.048338_g10755_i0~~NODE_11410_length_454_cov_32.048338_g10755_i0.p1  ORF type:complete len:125 (-),score=32.68 NODE_11410_length_454_cov_32.048338_g10755_i0:78-401(-)
MSFGGTGDEHPADSEVQQLCGPLRAEAQQKAQASGWNGIFTTFEPKSFKKQIVSGTNYFVKVQVSPTQHAHIRIHAPLPHTGQLPHVAGILLGKSEEDPIEYFDPTF